MSAKYDLSIVKGLSGIRADEQPVRRCVGGYYYHNIRDGCLQSAPPAFLEPICNRLHVRVDRASAGTLT